MKKALSIRILVVLFAAAAFVSFIPLPAQAQSFKTLQAVSDESLREIVSAAAFEKAEFTPNSDGVEDTVKGTITLAQKANVEVWITNAASVNVKKVLPFQVLEPGTYSFEWDGKDFMNDQSPDGPYWVKVTVERNTDYPQIIMSEAKVVVKDSYQIKIPDGVQRVQVTVPSTDLSVRPYTQRYTAKQGEIFTILNSDRQDEYEVLVNGSVIGNVKVTDVDIIDLDSIPLKWGTALSEGVLANSGPDGSSSVVEKLPNGKRVRILRQDGTWYRVVLDSGKQAFVRVSDLNADNQELLVNNLTISNREISPQYKVDQPLTTVSFDLARKSEVTVRLKKGDTDIYILEGTNDPNTVTLEPGEITCQWNGRNKDGYAVPDGEYKLYVYTRDLKRNVTNTWENPNWIVTVKGVGEWPLPVWRMKQIIPQAGFKTPEIWPKIEGKDKVDIKVQVAEKADLQISVVYKDGEPIYSFDKSVSEPGEFTFTWDGTTFGGSLAGDGEYYLKIQMKEDAGDYGAMMIDGAVIKVRRYYYTVVAGDTLGGIAVNHKTTVDAIVQANLLNPKVPLQAGQKLWIPIDPAKLPPDPGPTPGGDTTVYIVQAGDSLWKIAQKFGTTIDAVAKANNIDPTVALFPGQKLVIPLPPANPPSDGTVYTVQAGDTLWKIAQKYGTTIDVIAKANNLDPNKYLMIGQKIVIPGSPGQPGNTVYTVQSGDTLWKIAQKFNTTVDAIVKANNIDPAKYLTVGQKLVIPGQPPAPSPQPVTYIVQAGDTLWKIAQKFNTTIDALSKLNQIDAEKPIYVGQKLKIPA